MAWGEVIAQRRREVDGLHLVMEGVKRGDGLLTQMLGKIVEFLLSRGMWEREMVSFSCRGRVEIVVSSVLDLGSIGCL